MAICKKSTVFVQSWWYLVKMISSSVNHFHQVSWGLNKNCRFFNIGQFLSVSGFFYSDLTKCYFLKLHILNCHILGDHEAWLVNKLLILMDELSGSQRCCSWMRKLRPGRPIRNYFGHQTIIFALVSIKFGFTKTISVFLINIHNCVPYKNY